jgi:hypothetical protein
MERPQLILSLSVTLAISNEGATFLLLLAAARLIGYDHTWFAPVLCLPLMIEMAGE